MEAIATCMYTNGKDNNNWLPHNDKHMFNDKSSNDLIHIFLYFLLHVVYLAPTQIYVKEKIRNVSQYDTKLSYLARVERNKYYLICEARVTLALPSVGTLHCTSINVLHFHSFKY